MNDLWRKINNARFINRLLACVFYSVGNDLYQPQIVITINGFSGVKATTKSSFSLETTVSQRMFDSQ